MRLGNKYSTVRDAVRSVREAGECNVRIRGCVVDFDGSLEHACGLCADLFSKDPLYLVDLPIVRFDPSDFAANAGDRMVFDVPWLEFAIRAMIPPLLGGWTTSDGQPGWYHNRSEVEIAGRAKLAGDRTKYHGMVVVVQVSEYRDFSEGFEFSDDTVIREWVKQWQGRSDGKGHLRQETQQALMDRCRMPKSGGSFQYRQ